MSVVLVTGASRGIGRAIVERFAREDATVIACARGQAALDALRAALPQVECHACDMRDGDAVDALARDVLAQHGGEWIFRQLVAAGDAWRLRPLNPAYPTLDLPDLAAVRGVVIQRTTPGRRKSTTRYGQ